MRRLHRLQEPGKTGVFEDLLQIRVQANPRLSRFRNDASCKSRQVSPASVFPLNASCKTQDLNVESQQDACSTYTVCFFRVCGLLHSSSQMSTYTCSVTTTHAQDRPRPYDGASGALMR